MNQDHWNFFRWAVPLAVLVCAGPVLVMQSERTLSAVRAFHDFVLSLF